MSKQQPVQTGTIESTTIRKRMPMKNFARTMFAVATNVCLLGLSSTPVSADLVSFKWATVGNAGNVADTTTYGAVSDVYRMSKHEVTNGQYTRFLNAVARPGSISMASTTRTCRTSTAASRIPARLTALATSPKRDGRTTLSPTFRSLTRCGS